jgi:phosphatidylserine/phosphatidylglycerophosphate/cardiolipin synthase-like enzyme
VRIYTKGSDPSLASGVVRHLLNVIDSEESDVWLITPWLRDVTLPVSDIGHFASVFGGHRDQTSLSDLLCRTAQRHRLHLITKPPSELVHLPTVRRLIQLLHARKTVAAETELRGYEAVDEALTALNREAEALAEQAIQHVDTIRIAWELRDLGSRLLFLDRLHAKFLWSPVGALLGSANFTHGGFSANEELMVELSSPAEHARLGEVVREFEARSTPCDEFDLTPEIRRLEVSSTDFRQWPTQVEAAFPEHQLVALLRRLSTFV